MGYIKDSSSCLRGMLFEGFGRCTLVIVNVVMFIWVAKPNVEIAWMQVFKGKKMAGHMGAVRRTVKNVWIYKVEPERDLLWVRGQVSCVLNFCFLLLSCLFWWAFWSSREGMKWGVWVKLMVSCSLGLCITLCSKNSVTIPWTGESNYA